MSRGVYDYMAAKERVLYFDIMRIFATLFVIFNHTSRDGFFLFQFYPYTSIKYWIFLSGSIFCKFSVPLFFMISGALMLGKEEYSFYSQLNKTQKYVVIILVFSLIYAVSNYLIKGTSYSIKDFISLTWSSSEIGFHLWFLYAYIAYLIGFPILRKLAKCLSAEYFQYWIAVSVFFNAIPILEYILWKQKFVLYTELQPKWMLSTVILYPMVGYYLEHFVGGGMTWKKLVKLWMINSAGIILCAVATTIRAKDTGVLAEGESQLFFNCFVLINAGTVYLTIRTLIKDRRLGNSVKHWVSLIGENTFGIYLLHVLVMRIPISVSIKQVLLNSGIHPMIAVWLFILYVFGVGFMITVVLKKIPLINQII